MDRRPAFSDADQAGLYCGFMPGLLCVVYAGSLFMSEPLAAWPDKGLL